MAAYGEPSLVLQEDNFEPREKWKKIGDGFFSKVYKAYCYKHNGDVAAKEVRGDQLKEIQKLVKLSTHTHVVGIKGVYLDRDHYSDFIIMEYCSYSLSQLREILGKTYIPWPRCLHFMQQILSGVEFLHHNNIIHRDIKPENVMVTDSFVCKIADFGPAKDRASYTNPKTIYGFIQPSGTMVYNSPERWKSPADPAKESDNIYSCAMVFYKMITNADLFCMETRPQDESVLMDLRYYLVDQEYRHDLKYVGRGSPDTVPEIVITVIEGCWHVNPTERKTVQHWTELLREYIIKNVTSAQLATADTTLKRLLREGKSLTDCDDSKSPTTPLRNRTPVKRDTNDRPDSPTDEDLPTEDDQSPSEVDKPSTGEREGAVNHRGHADGSESPTDGHLPTSKPKPLVGLESQMSNLTVQSDGL
ncbi:serine/threonine protein kinase [Apostichopus japonicus]|uniref:Serine/threonine protein kinase n=1 Tax=Stichopus japonicus TaxID=307972 RepID=A0A2G8JMA5_STIJA|nr:serine/threonine protein kinase [Apostichopus japonicus]